MPLKLSTSRIELTMCIIMYEGFLDGLQSVMRIYVSALCTLLCLSGNDTPILVLHGIRKPRFRRGVEVGNSDTFPDAVSRWSRFLESYIGFACG